MPAATTAQRFGCGSTNRIRNKSEEVSPHARKLLPASVVSRKLQGRPPTIALAVGYKRGSTAPLLQVFLAAAAGSSQFRSPAD
jgi:hypothetical protein